MPHPHPAATSATPRIPRALALPVVVVTLALAGCDRKPAGSSVDTTAPPPDSALPAGTTAAPRVLGWSDEAGPVLVVQDADKPQQALVIFPEYTDSTLTDTTTFDLSSLGGTKLDLFAPGGLVASGLALAPLPPARRDEGCTAWPAARVVAPGAAAPSVWTVAFVSGRARPMPLDSLAGMAMRDSAIFAADVARLAGTLPDVGQPDFRGLPFVVRAAWRFGIDAATEGLVADVVRRVNAEANPRVEHVLLVGERVTGGRWQAAYSERTAGSEETLEVSDVRAGVWLGAPPRATLVVARDYGDGEAFALLERAGPLGWRVRWSSAYAGC